MVQGNEALLHVGAGAQLLRGPQQHAHLAGVHLAEQVSLLIVGVVVVDEGDLVGRDALLNQRLLEIIVHAEATHGRLHGAQPVGALGLQFFLGRFHVLQDALRLLVAQRCRALDVLGRSVDAGLERLVFLQLGLGLLDRRAQIRKHQLGALHIVVLLVAVNNLVRSAVNATAFLALGDFMLHQADVHRRLAGVSHDAQDVVIPLLGRSLARFNDGSTPGDVLHVGFLGRRLVQRQRGAASALERRQRELCAVVFLAVGLLDVIHRHRISHLVKHLQQIRRVHEVAHAVAGLVAVAAGRLHPHLVYAGEGVGPGVERVEALRLHLVGHQVPHHVVHLGQRVGNRRAGGKHHALAATVLVVDLVGLQVHIVGTLRAGAVAQSLHPVHLGAEHQVLEHMGFVDKQLVHAQLAEVQQIVHRPVAQRLDAVFQALLQGFELLDGALFLLLVAVAILHRLDGLHDLLDLALVELVFKLGGRADESEAAVRHHHGIPVARGDLGQELAPIGLFKVLFRGREHVGAGVQAVEVCGPLLDQVVGNSHQRLVGQAGALQFHRAGHHGEGLASANHMVQQGSAVLHDAGNRVALVAAELDDAVGHLTGEGHVRAVIFPRHVVVVGVVVGAGQQLGAVRVAEKPVIEAGLDLGGFAVGLFRRVHVRVGLALVVTVGDFDGPVVHQRVQNGVAAHGRRAPGVGQRDIAAFLHDQLEGTVDLLVLHCGLGFVAEQALGEVLINRGRNPRRADAGGNLMRRHVLGLHRLQCLDVAEHGR